MADREFVVAGQHRSEHRDFTCKFKADQYHIMAWRTPGNYSIGMEQFADNGVTSFVGCKVNNTLLEGQLGFLEGGQGTCRSHVLQQDIAIWNH